LFAKAVTAITVSPCTHNMVHTLKT